MARKRGKGKLAKKAKIEEVIEEPKVGEVEATEDVIADVVEEPVGKEPEVEELAEPITEEELAELSAEELGDPSDGEVVEESASDEAAEELSEPADEEAVLDLEDAARRFVVGYKDAWYKSIEAFAKTRKGFSGKATKSECCEILKAWGAKLK